MSRLVGVDSKKSFLTAIFKLRDDIHSPKDWIPSALVDPKQIASKKQDARTIDDTYLYIITEDEKLLITQNNTLDVMLEGGVNRVTHAQIAKHAKNGLVRAAGMIYWDASACKWVANNKSGHFTPFLDDNTAHYTLSILEKNGISNARFDAIPESMLADKKILPKNCIGYKESAVLSTHLQDALLEYEQKLGQAVSAVPYTAELKSAYSAAQRAHHVDVINANHAQQEAAQMRAIKTTNAQTALLNQTQLAELRKAKTAHEAYKSRGENANSQEAWHFMSSTASVLNVCSSGLSANRDFAPVARTFLRAANTISGVVAARAAGMCVAKWAGSAALGTATAGIGFALTAFSTLVSFFSDDDDSSSALAGMEDRIRGDISEFRSEFKDYRKEFRVAIQVLQQDIRTVGMMVSQVLVELRGVAGLCAQTLQSLLQLELFIREQATITNAQLQSIQTHPLELARLTLEKYVTGKGCVPTHEELRSSLTQMELWITEKLHQPAINDVICARLSSERVSTLLAERSGNSLLGLVAARLRLHFGDVVPAEFSALPPMDLFLSLSQLYFSAVEKSLSPSGDAYASVCEKIKSTGDSVSGVPSCLVSEGGVMSGAPVPNMARRYA